MRTLSLRAQVLIGLAVLVVVGVVVFLVARALAGPSSPGDVTFGAGGTSVEVGAGAFCDVQVTECGSDPEASGVLRVPPNTPLTVAVPEEVASTPWQLAFTFRDAAGAIQQGRSPVFAPGTSSSFTLVLPAAADQLESAEVQQYGARITQGPNGVEFATRSTWVMGVLM